MNLAEAAQLILTLSLKDEVSSGLKNIQKNLDGTSKKGATLSSGLSKIGQGVGVGIRNTARIGAVGLGLLWTQVDAGIDSLVELEDVTNQTNAVIKSTGGVAGLTAEDIRDLANEMEELSGVDDKVVQSGANVLLTFKNIGKDAFEPATLAALDMSEAMDQDLQSSIVQIGKALNDPIAGITALTRVGVTFTEEQKEVIKTLVETGDVAGAQAIILAELNSEFGGSAQASMEGYRGTQLRLKDTWEELQMTLATALLPALDNLSRTLREKLMDPAVKEGVKKLGEGIAQLFSAENVKGGGEALKGLFTFLKELPWASIKDGLSFAAENAKKVVEVFRSLPPGVQAGLLTFLAANKLTGGLITSGLGELVKVALSSLRTITAANVTVVGGAVTGGGSTVPGAAPGGSKFGGITATLAGVTVVGGALLMLDEEGVTQAAATKTAIQGLHPVLTDSQRTQANMGLNVIDLATKVGNLLLPVHQTANATQENINLARQALLVNSGAKDRLGLIATRADATYMQALEARRLQQIANLTASRAEDALMNIKASSARTAQKDFSMNVTVHTNLNVSGQRIAQNISRIERLMGNPDY